MKEIKIKTKINKRENPNKGYKFILKVNGEIKAIEPFYGSVLLPFNTLLKEREKEFRKASKLAKTGSVIVDSPMEIIIDKVNAITPSIILERKKFINI
jgi:hypothetical protein